MGSAVRGPVTQLHIELSNVSFLPWNPVQPVPSEEKQSRKSNRWQEHPAGYRVREAVFSDSGGGTAPFTKNGFSDTDLRKERASKRHVGTNMKELPVSKSEMIIEHME